MAIHMTSALGMVVLPVMMALRMAGGVVLMAIVLLLVRMAWVSGWRRGRPQVNPQWRALSGETVDDLRDRLHKEEATAPAAYRPRYPSDAAWRHHAGCCALCFEALWRDGEPCCVGRDLRPIGHE